MSPTIRHVLVVGGGIAGMAAAIRFAESGVRVRLIDLDPNWRVYGAGITITGPTLRAMDALGILDRVVDEGHVADGVAVCSRQGERLTTIETPSLIAGRSGYGAGGILRPVLHRILSDRIRTLDIDVRLGLTVESFEQSRSSVSVCFSDGVQDEFDLVVGADGIASAMRGRLFPDSPSPEFTGQACWRLMLPRTAEIDRRHFFLGGPVKVGLTPVSETQMYMFLLERVASRAWVPEEAQPRRLSALLEGYGGTLAGVRADIDQDANIVYRPLEGMLLPAPWFQGRIVLIGDAVHATTPQLASGAGMSIEDALVLVEETTNDGDVETALRRFMARRFERCRLVVENSLEIGQLEVKSAPATVQAELVQRSLDILAEAI